MFKTFSELELHLDVGDYDHGKSNETVDKLRRQWATKLETIDQPVSNLVIDAPDKQQPASKPPNVILLGSAKVPGRKWERLFDH